jgi:hypothetical protein
MAHKLTFIVYWRKVQPLQSSLQRCAGSGCCRVGQGGSDEHATAS